MKGLSSNLKTPIYIFYTGVLINLQVFAGDLVSGLERTTSFFTGVIVPILASLGLSIAGATFYFGENRQATIKSIYILIGTIIVFVSGWIIDQLGLFFGR